jgi:hypothetical protein
MLSVLCEEKLRLAGAPCCRRHSAQTACGGKKAHRGADTHVPAMAGQTNQAPPA